MRAQYNKYVIILGEIIVNSFFKEIVNSQSFL